MPQMIAAILIILTVLSLLIGVLSWFVVAKLSPYLKHMQLYQVTRAQFLRPYTERKGVLEPRYTNQLGNNLFQYAYTRLRARHLQMKFSAGPLNQDIFHDDMSGQPEPKIVNPFAKAVPFEHLEPTADYTIENIRPSKDETARFLQTTPNAFAQDFSLYAEDADLVRSWLAPSVECHMNEAKVADRMGVNRDDTVVFHLRFAGAVEGWLADPTYHELPMTYYTEVLRNHGRCNRAILVHDPKSKKSAQIVARMFKKANPSLEIIMQCASRCEDFMVMFKARHLALSVSTFAWWAGFLGNSYKRTVYYPQHEAQPFYHPRSLKCWYNKLMPNEKCYCPVQYTTAPCLPSRKLTAV